MVSGHGTVLLRSLDNHRESQIIEITHLNFRLGSKAFSDLVDTVSSSVHIISHINTHANGDHTHGKGACHYAEIISSEGSAREMPNVTP